MSSENSNGQRLVTRSTISFQLLTYGESDITNRLLLNLHRLCVFCCLFRVDNLLILFRELLANLSKIRGDNKKNDTGKVTVISETLVTVTLQCAFYLEYYCLMWLHNYTVISYRKKKRSFPLLRKPSTHIKEL